MDIVARRALVEKYSLCFNCLNAGHPAQKCKSKFRCHLCKLLHHSSLHSGNTKGPLLHNSQLPSQEPSSTHHNTNVGAYTNNLNPSTAAFNPSTTDSVSTTQINSYTSFHNKQSTLTILPTAIVQVADQFGTLHPCRILLDSGSQASFVSEDCVQRLGLKREKAKIVVQGLASTKTGITRGKLTLLVSSRASPRYQLFVQAYILDKLSAPQPSQTFTINDLNTLKNYNLADPDFNKSRKIDMIIEAEHFTQILRDGRIFISSDIPMLQNTIFGYIISGSISRYEQPSNITSLYVDLHDLDSNLRKFWEIEELPNETSSLTNEEDICETHFTSTHYVDPTTNRYVVKLPFKGNAPPLGNSLCIATARLKALERRFEQDSILHTDYINFISEYENLQHLEPIPSNILSRDIEHMYLPHHAVVKASSTTTRLRVVFNASTPTTSGYSLNQKLLVGPKIQRDLLPILLSFRSFKIAVVADIEKMYRQILIHPDDRNFQRILWRKNSKEPIQHLWLNTVTYGMSAAPFLATRALKQLTIEFQGKYPLAEEMLKNHFYVDDLLGGANNETEAVELYHQLNNVLQRRGFTLRKWASNSKHFLKAIPSESFDNQPLKINEHPENLKVLGLSWIPTSDCFTFGATIPRNSIPTKRNILSETSKIFDPLGLISPVTITFKILLQQLWLKRYDWDEVCGEFAERWSQLRNNLVCLEDLHISRWIPAKHTRFELHGFADASESAYAAVLYGRTTLEDNTIQINIIAAKTKVAPIKQVSIPRLELCGALLLAKLMKFIKCTLHTEDNQCFAWTDSTVVLSWLSSHPRKWKCFIGNRTASILSIIPRSQWHHVQSSSNPADLASRGLQSSNLVKSTLWWEGPRWLKTDWKQCNKESLTSVNEVTVKSEQRERYVGVFQMGFSNETLTALFKDLSSLSHILRILAKCFIIIMGY